MCIRDSCIQAMQQTLVHCDASLTRVLLIPESHTRNIFYLENVAVLQEIIQKAGFAVRIGSLLEELNRPNPIVLPSGKTLILEPLQRKNNRVFVENFDPCFILLNNDLSNGLPTILESIEQTICPSTHLGWNKRLKTTHFQHYQNIAQEFSELVNIDPWFITPFFKQSATIDFMKQQGVEELKNLAEQLLQQIQSKYQEYDIQEKPFIVIKSNAGTYGMNVMTIHDPIELNQLNRKQRTKMSVGKTISQ
jgi:glutamate--cysteine ligase